MELYKKPLILRNESINGIIPFAIAGAPLTVTVGVSLAQAAAAAAVAALAGGAVGAAVARKGNNIIVTEFTNALTARKDFSLA